MTFFSLVRLQRIWLCA